MRQILFYFYCVLAVLLFSNCSKDIDDHPKSSMRAISTFAFEPYHNAENNIVITHQGVIDQTNKLIKVQLPPDVVLTNLRPKIGLSPWTTVSPASLEYVDFSRDTVDFVVTAESGKTAVYSVVCVTDYVYTKAELYSLEFPEILNEGGDAFRTIVSSFNNNTTVNVQFPAGTDLTKLLVDLYLSPASKGCTISVSEDGLEASYRPFSNPEVINFSKRVSFKITPQKGSSINYRINATLKPE